ncbi:hypothetical protein BC940DRAFT_310010 [Gongronella butleri]|nr:hypothetical protein BC940DRAFT_310010 [Gongronella butleri]
MILRFVSLALICSVERLLTSTVARRHSFNTVVVATFFLALSRTSLFSLVTCRFLVRCVLRSGVYGQTTSDAFTET